MPASLTVLASAFCAAASFLKRDIAGVWFSGLSLLGSIGGCPPFGDASVRSTPASRKTKYGAANSSSQKPVFRPVLPRTSCEVSTIRIFTCLLLVIGVAAARIGAPRYLLDRQANQVALVRWYRAQPGRSVG